MIERTCALEPTCEVCQTESPNGAYNPKSNKFICQDCLDDMRGNGEYPYLVEEVLKHCQIVKDGYVVEEKLDVTAK